MQVLKMARKLFPIKIGAVYHSERDATLAANSVIASTHKDSSVAIVAPTDSDQVLSKKLDSPDWGRGFPFFKGHAIGALAGAVLGALLATLFTLAGPNLTQDSPVFAYSTFIYVGALVGLMGAGFFTFRLDQDALTFGSMDAKHQGQWVVIYQGQDAQEADHVQQKLKSRADRVLRTF